MEDIIDIIVTETTNTIEITSQSTDEVIDVNIIDNREDITLNVTPTVVEININSLTGNFGINWGEITGTLSNQTDLNTALGLKADLVGGKVPSSQLPSYVDDVVEVANYAALPTTGETGKIYVTIDTNYIYRWTGSVYVEIKDSSAVWGAITGTLSNQTDLQNALNAKANDNAVVHNTGNESVAGLKTFTSGISADYLWIKEGTGLANPSGYAQLATDLTYFHFNNSNNTAFARFLYGSGQRTYTLPDSNGTIALTSDLHNAVTIGTANGLSLSTQVLSLGLASSSANGALSSTDWSTFNGKQNALSGTGFVKISGSTISYDNSTYLTTSSAASTYLPLSGGTLTGALNGTSGTFTGNVSTSAQLRIESSGNAILLIGSRTSGTVFEVYNSSNILRFYNGTVDALQIATGSGAVTLAGALSGTSATFSSILTSVGATINGANNAIIDLYNTALADSNARNWRIVTNESSWGALEFRVSTANNNAPSSAKLILAKDGAATFSSSVTANGSTTAWGVTAQFGNSYGNRDIRIGTDTTIGENYIQSYVTSTNATRQLSINPYGGNVGIGTTSPGGILEARAGSGANFRVTANGTNVLLFQNYNDTDAYQDMQFAASTLIFNTGTAGGGNSSERMRITSGGNVGIGTTSPQDLLDVSGSLRLRGATPNWTAVTDNAVFDYVNTSIFSTSPVLRIASIGTSSVGANMSFHTGTSTALTERMRITSAGNVGIGTNSPTTYSLAGRHLELNDAGGGYAFYHNMTTSVKSFWATNESAGLSALFTFSNHPLTLGTNNTERMRITSGGHIQTNGNPVYAYSGSISIGGTYQTIFAAVSGGVYLVSVTTDSTDGTFGLLTVINDPDKSLGMIYGNNISLQFSGDNVQMKSTNGSTYNTTWTATRLK